MKLKYTFEIMDMDDEVVAVPVGDNAEEFHGLLRLNADAAEMLQLIAKYDHPAKVHDALCQTHPDEDRNEIGQELCTFLNKLIAAGILVP